MNSENVFLDFYFPLSTLSALVLDPKFCHVYGLEYCLCSLYPGFNVSLGCPVFGRGL